MFCGLPKKGQNLTVFSVSLFSFTLTFSIYFSRPLPCLLALSPFNVVHRRRTQLQSLIAISQGWGPYKLGDKQDFLHAGWQRPGNGNEKLYITISSTILFIQPGITLTLHNNSQMTVTDVRRERGAPHVPRISISQLNTAWPLLLCCNVLQDF